MESFAEGVGSLLHLLEDEQLKQTPQDRLFAVCRPRVWLVTPLSKLGK